MVDELIFSEKLCDIERFCNVRAFLNLKGLYIRDLDLAGPLCFVSGHFDLVPGPALYTAPLYRAY